ncbi:DUF998 domain-containing protein [Rhodococcus sp. IEGM 248]|uniref:DUF998 domain-containing protein n=1 Tax=Rhodococcus opacus TaxID=37919 RepID=UPI0013BEFF6F|nr:DUF998 domain-containing protein [Rhodococcus opacus]MDV7083433.1 DUF998 domain-containing protein [Rhodococcus opacus]NDV03483.1 DUF998 domain-containing protein [Rhodococcus sp. IEGM 248]
MPSHVLETSKRTPLYLTVAVLQLFVVEFLVAGTWRGHYSYSANFISDLGVPFCGTDGNAPCSKTSLLMDASFVVTGLAYMVAAVLWHRIERVLPPAPVVFLVVAGIGGVVVGLAPSNTHWELHSLGATLFLIFGSLFTLTTALTVRPRISGPATYLALALGVLGLVGYFCFTYSWDLGLGVGGIERVAAYSAILGFVVCVHLVTQLQSVRHSAVVRVGDSAGA